MDTKKLLLIGGSVAAISKNHFMIVVAGLFIKNKM